MPPEVLQQISEKNTGSEVWTELCNLFEGKQTEATKAYTLRLLVNELWEITSRSEDAIKLQLCKIFSITTELATLNYTIADMYMVKIMLESLPYHSEYDSLKSSI